MSDEKQDIVEEAKSILRLLDDLDLKGPLSIHHTNLGHIIKIIIELISELERLRLKNVTYSNLVNEHTAEIIRLNKEINSIKSKLSEVEEEREELRVTIERERKHHKFDKENPF